MTNFYLLEANIDIRLQPKTFKGVDPMSQYITPGVYVEEPSSGSRSIKEVETSVTGMLGLTELGPVSPHLVTNMGDFIHLYGGYLENSYLADAVDGFFANGGTKCFIARVTNNGIPASRSFENFKVKAIGPGEWGNNIGIILLDASSGNSVLFNLW